jgi:hypothetical protein
MWLTLISLAIVAWLLSTAYGLLPMLKTPQWDNPFAKPPYYDYDYMTNVTDTTRREGAWVGFLQEDVYKNRTGPIGDFVGNDSPSDKAPLYFLKGLDDPDPISKDTVMKQVRVFPQYQPLGE